MTLANSDSTRPTAAESHPPATALEKRFDWPLCYKAEELVLKEIESFCGHNSTAARLSQRMRSETGTLLIDWIDHLALPGRAEEALFKAGFIPDPLCDTPTKAQTVLWHPEAMLPRVIVDQTMPEIGFSAALSIRVDSLSDFITAHRLTCKAQGEPFTRLRRVLVSLEAGARFEAVERSGYRGYSQEDSSPDRGRAWREAEQLWKTRPRQIDEDAAGFKQAHALLDRVIGLVGRNLACHIVFTQERVYWEQRNRAAQVQKRRQDGLGLGWANQDHHTFRSSRARFLDLMLVLEKLGFERRERYYAGAQAGWGAQILEHPVEGVVAFCDVDLEPQETRIDFSRQGLPPARRLGTIGLWTELHGESFLEAGMHHLECRFDFSLLQEQLAAEGVNIMKPFSDFAFLKQAFTQGERWPVRRERAQRLREAGFIDETQFQQFVNEGAIGSHLENLQRRGGFKGFNQSSVSAIIQATDPRAQDHGA